MPLNQQGAEGSANGNDERVLQAGSGPDARGDQQGGNPGSEAVVADSLSQMENHEHERPPQIRRTKDLNEFDASAWGLLRGSLEHGGRKFGAQLRRHSLFHIRDGAFRFGYVAASDQPARTFRNAPPDKPDEYCADRAEQDDPTPAINAERAARHKQPGDQRNQWYGGELHDLIDGECAAANFLGHQLGDVCIDRHQLDANADACNHPPEQDSRWRWSERPSRSSRRCTTTTNT